MGVREKSSREKTRARGRKSSRKKEGSLRSRLGKFVQRGEIQVIVVLLGDYDAMIITMI